MSPELGPELALALAMRSIWGASTSNQKVEPFPSALTNPTSPPMIWAIARVIARPRPDPPNCRDVDPSACWKRWNNAACAAGAIPTPLSSTSKRNRRGDASASRRVRRACTSPLAVNFTALPIRLNRAWRRRTGSTIAQVSSPSKRVTRATPFASAWGRSSSATLFKVAATSVETGDSSSRPASIFEKSTMSLSSCASICPEFSASATIRRASADRVS